MKTLITLTIATALLAGSSAFAQYSTGHDFSRAGDYRESKVGQRNVEHRESASNRTVSRPGNTGHDFSRTGNYRQPKVDQRNVEHRESASNRTVSRPGNTGHDFSRTGEYRVNPR